MRLQDVLDAALDILMHPEFKSFGDLQKARYQHSKSDDEIFLRQDMYKNTIQDPAHIEKYKKIRAKKKDSEIHKKGIEKARKTRKDWYKDPRNKQAFLEKIKKRDQKKKYLKEQQIKKN